MSEGERKWPPIPGDFEVKDPNGCVAVCTLGKKIKVSADYAIIGTCKTENIGIERIIANVVSNPNIRFFVLAGPEIPGHHTGQTLRSLYENGVDEKTRKIINAPGAIPYIENVPLDAVERFRNQVELIDMLRNQNPEEIAKAVQEAIPRNPGPINEDPIWVSMATKSSTHTKISTGASVNVLPEFGLGLDTNTSLLMSGDPRAMVCTHPSSVVAEVKSDEKGTMLVCKEL